MLTILLIGAVAIAAVGLIAAAILLTHIEDWHRDLTTNVAATDESSKEERLRPLHSALEPEALADRVITAVKPLANWQLAARTSQPPAVTLHFVRTTRLFRFRDDIHVQVQPAPGGSILTATSRSRVGKGDLGQNPRNLRELLAAVRQAIR